MHACTTCICPFYKYTISNASYLYKSSCDTYRWCFLYIQTYDSKEIVDILPYRNRISLHDHCKASKEVKSAIDHKLIIMTIKVYQQSRKQAPSNK